jgi:YbbR domain-containing protein
MKDTIKRVFLDNWVRKVISFFLAILVWFLVSQSLKTSKNYTSNLTNSYEEIK